MKIKTFILTFLMMMSSPFLFGQHWEDPGTLGYQNSMTVYAQVKLDNVVQTDDYQVAAFHGDQLLAVSEIIPFQGTTSNYHVHLQIYGDNSMGNIYFKFFNGTKEYVSETEFPFEVNVNIGDHPNYSTINFYSVAQIADVVYPSLQKAINACKEGDNTIKLLANISDDVEISETTDVNITIDGGMEKEYSGTINIVGNSTYGNETLTIKAVKFVTSESGHDFIWSDSQNAPGRYANNVTVEDCYFVATGDAVNSAVALRIRQGKNINVKRTRFEGLHSAMQMNGTLGINVEGATIKDCKSGISASGANSLLVENSTITVSGYGVRADGSGAYEMTLTDNTISAELPVVIRKTTGDYKLDINGTHNNYTATNTEGYHVVFTKGDDGTYEAPTGDFQLTIADGTELNVFPVYVAKIGTKGYQSLAEAYTAATDSQIITLLDNITINEKFVIAKSITLDGNDKTLTYTGTDRAIDIYNESNKVEDVTIKNLTLNFTSGYSQRGINYNENGNLTLDNVTVNGSSVVTYALNLPSNSDNAEVTITNSEFTGKIALNVWGADAEINATDSHFTSVDNAETENYAAVKLNNNGTDSAEGTVINITGGSITAKDENGDPSFAATNATATGEINISGTTQVTGNTGTTVAVVIYEGASDFYGCSTLQDAVNRAGGDSKATVKLLRNVETSELIKVEKAVVIDLNGKTVTANCKKAFEVHANATIKNGTIWSQQRCVDTRKNVELTLTDVTLEAPTYYSTHLNQQPLTIGGSDNGTKVTMTNVNINAGTTGYAIISFVKTNLKATDSNFSGYSALYVKEGSEESEFKFEGSTLKGDIGSNDVEGNSFATIATEEKNVTVTLDANSILKSVGENHLAISVESEGNEITVTGVIEATNFLDGSTNVNANTIKVKAEYADELLAEGYATSEADANGLVQVSGLAVAKVGETYYKTLADAFAAAQNGDEVKILAAGTYALNTSGKNITITGAVDGVVFDNIGAKNMGSANVTFNNVTFDYYPNVNYTGLQHSGNLVYNECTFEGQPFLYGTSETFNNCTFNQNSADAYNVWTYGAKEVVFNECTFNSAGKSVLIYTESATTFNTVTVTDCDFIASAPVEGKAAIEMDSSLSAGINLTIDGETTATGFGSGNVSGESLWNNKKGNQGVNNDITVIVDNVVVLAPTTVAKIGETEYNTLQGAITAAGTTTTQINVVGTTTEENITIADNADITLTFAENVTLNGYFAPFEGNLTINGGIINNTNSGASAIEITSGELNLNGVNIASARHAVRIDGAVTATIDGGEYHGGKTEGTRHAINVSDAANVTIKAGTFVGPKGTTADSGSAVNVQSGATVTIEGGDFSGGKNNTLASAGTLVVTGGTFDQDPSAYVTTPYVVIKKSDNEYNVIKGVAKIGETYYESLAAAITAATAGNTIVLLKDITENVTVGKNVTIDGAEKNYTGKMEMTNKADITVKNVNFDGKGYNGYAIESRGAYYITVEDCTAENYYGFIQLASGNVLTTIKDVTVSNMNYGVKVDYSNAVVLENLNLDCAVAAVLNSNYGEKTITIKNSDLSILGTWKRNNTIKTTYVFEGANTVDQFIIEEELDNFKLADVNSTLTAPNEITVTTDVEGYKVDYADGKYFLRLPNYVAQIGETKYELLAAAIDAASAGNTIVLLADINENVTVDKKLTIDGDGHNSTGLISTNKNVTYTFKNFNIDGANSYFVKVTGGGGNYVFDNCNIKNSWGLIHTNKSTNTVSVRNSIVDNCEYGVAHFTSLNSATLENVTVQNSAHGLMVQNQAAKTIKFVGCNISATKPVYIWEKGTSIITFNFEGENTFDGELGVSTTTYGKLVLTTAEATLTAPEGYNVTTTVEGLKVYYADGKYYLGAPDYVAAIGEVQYESLQAAIDAAQDGDEIDLIKSIYVTEVNNDNTTEILVSGGVSYRALYTVSGKSVTIDLNDNILYSTAVAADFMYNVFAVANGGHLTIKTDGLNGHGQVINEAASSVCSLLFCYDGTMTIENGNYNLKNGGNGRGMIYSQQDETVTVNGGKFILGNVGELDNGSPWIFNASGQNTKNIIVNGGTFNDDILHQYYPFEVMAQKEKALKYDAVEELWTMEDAVAYVDEQHKSGNWYTNEVGFVSLEEAFAAAAKYNHDDTYVTTVTLLDNVELSTYVTISKSVNLNLGQFNITRVDGTALYFNGEGIEVTIDGEGTVSGTQAVYVDNGTVTIDGGNYVGNIEAVYVINNGHAVINGGTFQVEEGDDANFLLNEYDATRDVTTIAVYGGTFHGFNPENNAAEGANTNFCAPGHSAVETAAGSNIWEVMPVQKQNLVKGWNWYSSYLNITTENLLGALGTNGKSIVQNSTWSATYYGVNDGTDYGWGYESHIFDVSKMYMIETSQACELALSGNLVDASTITITLNPGWNWIGYPSNVEVRLEDALDGLQPSHGDEIKTQGAFASYYDYEGQSMWLTYSFGNGNMKPTKGYMYNNTSGETKTFTYNIVPATTRGNNETEVATHYSVDYTKYPFNMTMTAVVDGAIGDNYEVAALVNGEVRGSARTVYVEVLDAYMLFLTISGDNVEEVSFKYYDLTTGEEYDLVNRIDYSNNAMVGSVNEPYVLSRGTTGIGDAAMSQVNIYPNPTTTGTEINLEAVCDTVEVFNALGVKVAEYQNVDSIDALETAGIYVIRITNDGNVQNCRLVVK